MKTIFEYLQELPEPARSKAVFNTPLERGNKPIQDKFSALIVAFVWDYAPEGVKYWQNVFNDLRHGTDKKG